LKSFALSIQAAGVSAVAQGWLAFSNIAHPVLPVLVLKTWIQVLTNLVFKNLI